MKDWTLISTPEGSGMQHVFTSLHVRCTPDWGSLLGLRQSQCRVLLLAFWLKLETFLNFYNMYGYYIDCPFLVIPAWCHLRWVDETALERSGCCTWDGIFTPDVSQQITLFPTFCTCLVPPRKREIQTTVIPLHAPLKLQHVYNRDLRFLPFLLWLYVRGEAVWSELQSPNQLHICVLLKSACSIQKKH